MPERFAKLFAPKDVALLRRVLQLICDARGVSGDDLATYNVASELIVAFGSGIRTEEGLMKRFAIAHPLSMSRSASA